MTRVRVVWDVEDDGSVWGLADDASTGEPICAVVGTIGFFGARDYADLIDRFLSPALDAKLTEMVGPLVTKLVRDA